MENIKFFGLLHIAKDELSAVNLKVRDFSEQIDTYLGNAALLSQSLTKQGLNFKLLTNNADFLKSRKHLQSENLEIEQIEFPTSVPSGISFYSAHFKIDVFRHIAQLNLDYAIFCDLDMICLKPLPKVFENLVSEKIPMVYEVTDQIIPAGGHNLMIRDLEVINAIPSEGKWMGGEFIAGTPEFFDLLVSQIDDLLPSYFQNLASGKVSSLGNDEIYTTAAIERLKRKNIYISEAGLSNIVGRYWSSGTGFFQKPLGHLENLFLVHLPADKKFLRNYYSNHKEFQPLIFIKEYKKFLKIQKIKSVHRQFLYFLFRLKSRTPFLKDVKIENFKQGTKS